MNPLIADIIEECHRQDDEGPEAVAALAMAAEYTRDLTEKVLLGEQRLTEGVIYSWLEGTVARASGGNVLSFRDLPLIYPSDTAPPDMIQRQVRTTIEAAVDGRITPQQAYELFETTHPFDDYNGRMGWLMWSLLASVRAGQWVYGFPQDPWVVDKAHALA